MEVILLTTDINPISSLHDDIVKIIETSIIKFQFKATPGESLDVRKYVDRYFDAMLKMDTFFSYFYTDNEYQSIGITEILKIREYQKDQSLVPNEIREVLLDNRRRAIIKSFEEPNEYYRLLNGQPYLDDMDFFYVPEEISKQYGIPLNMPIHKIEDEMGEYYISIVESLGYIETLIEQNPDKEYLKHLGSRRISIYKARTAKNFDLLYLSNTISKTVKDKFEVVYSQCREYVTSVIYNHYVSEQMENYDSFIGLIIMTMAIEQLCARSIENAMHREFFDIYTIKILYESYNFPFIERLNPDVQKALVHNMNLLIQHKAHNQVFTTVANLLGFFNVHIYEHVLVKEHKFDSYGNPIFKKKDIVDPFTGDIREVYDLESMFDVYFQKIELGAIDRLNAFDEDFLKEDYLERVEPDPFWWLDSGTYEEVWEADYNYAETKYLSISISYRTMEMIFENIFLLRMILDNQNSIDQILLTLPKILPDVQLRLFDIIIFLICLLCKKHGLRGEITTNPSAIIAVIDEMDGIRNYSENKQIDCLSFNFEFFNSKEYLEDKDIMFHYFSEEEQEQFLKYIQILDISSFATVDRKKEALNNMYKNIKYLYRFIGEKLEESTDINEYAALRRFYRAAFYSKELNSSIRYDYKDGTRTTFFTLLQEINSPLYDFLTSIDDSMIGYYASHAIAKIEEIIPNIKYLYANYDLDSPVEEALIRMIRYLKSYTTDFIGLDVIHIFDDKSKNMIKLIDTFSSTKIMNIHSSNRDLNLADDLYKTSVKLITKSDIPMRDELSDRWTKTELSDKITFREEFINNKVHVTLSDNMNMSDTVSKTISSTKLNDNIRLRDSIKWYDHNPYEK